ncbi:phosphoenolpyruvate--protein phosphotransferase [Anaerolineales bacterium HSG24]|nr:phosphoenolpyruvate--protein phosphotransferase [Anaerolineales bacterium HSG24]
MVGIVVVSHSYKLAAGVLDLVEQMTQGQASIAAAAGIDDPANPIGTDAFRVQDAIESVYSDDGVMIMMDLGSAILSAETAKEFLSPDQQPNVYLCEAPLVEGTIAAAVQSLVTTDIHQILDEARGSLRFKANQLCPAEGEEPIQSENGLEQSPALPEQDAAIECRLVVHNHHGLHARPSAQLVKVAAQFEANVTIGISGDDSSQVNAKSINQVMMLAVKSEQIVVIKATGPTSFEAIVALQSLVADRFGEVDSMSSLPASDTPSASSASSIETAAANEWQGIPVSAGVVIGRAVRYQPTLIEVPHRHTDNPSYEHERLQQAIAEVYDELEATYQQHQHQLDEEAAIFEAHQLLLTDPTLLDKLQSRLKQESLTAETAWQICLNELITQYHALPEPYMQAKAIDWLDISQQVLRVLTDNRAINFELDTPAILITTDLTPSEAIALDPNIVIGLCTESGSATSHTAIIARGLGIPTVVGLSSQLSQVADGTPLVLNGSTGQLWVEPSAEQQERLQADHQQWLTKQQQFEQYRHQPAQTKDNQSVTLLANIATLADLSVALKQGAQGVGLLRTEFFYSQQKTLPTEMEQTAYYKAIAESLGPHPLTIRTLDVGGDKPLAYLNLKPELNPFLGRRGIRASLAEPEILQIQLQAILRASVGHKFKIMFPMISTMAEVRAAKQILQAAQAYLQQAGVPFEEHIPIGIMIELPAAVIIADLLATEVDFFSLGTNDLAQYTMAADRTNPDVVELVDPFHPALLRLIQQTVIAAHQADIDLSLCGEIASNPLAIPLLLGLGVMKFSMNAPAIPQIKQVLAQVTMAQAKDMAQTALGLESAEAVRNYASRQ